MKGTCLLQGGVAASGEGERVSELLEAGEHDLGCPGAGADFPRGPGVRGRVPGVWGTGELWPGDPRAGEVPPGGLGAGKFILVGPGVGANFPRGRGAGALVPGGPGAGAHLPEGLGAGALVSGGPEAEEYLPGGPGAGELVPGGPGAEGGSERQGGDFLRLISLALSDGARLLLLIWGSPSGKRGAGELYFTGGGRENLACSPPSEVVHSIRVTGPPSLFKSW